MNNHSEGMTKHQIWLALREEILQRDNWRCQVCSTCRLWPRWCCNDPHLLYIHHKIPRVFGGTDNPSNLITLCIHCHGAVEHGRLGSWQIERLAGLGISERQFYQKARDLGCIIDGNPYQEVAWCDLKLLPVLLR